MIWRTGAIGLQLLGAATSQPTSRPTPAEVPDVCSSSPPPQLLAGGIVAALTRTQLLFGGADRRRQQRHRPRPILDHL